MRHAIAPRLAISTLLNIPSSKQTPGRPGN
jgi:hypothetical protein